MKFINKLAIATALGALAAPMAIAQNDPISNPMTNIVTFVPGCQMATVGVDFGVHPAGAIGTAITSSIGNTSNGNTLTGNGNHSEAAADDGESVGATTGIGPVDLIINTALNAVSFDVAGIYVVCTSAATNVVVDGQGTDLTVDLSATAAINDATFTSVLDPASTPNGATGTLNYGITFVGPVAVADPGVPGVPAVTTALLVANGSIPAGQTAVGGQYSDVVAVTLNY